MENPINFWRNQLGSFDGANLQKLDGILALESNFSQSEYFNNIGVLFEKAQEPVIAKVFYLRSLGHDFLNAKVWINFTDIGVPSSSLLDIELIVLYFLQSNFFITLYLVLCLGFAIVFSFNVLRKKLNYFLIFKRTLAGFLLIAMAYLVNNKGVFYFSKSTIPVYAGPSSIFKTERSELKKGRIVIIFKKNNGYSKIFNFGNRRNEWVKTNQLISI